MAINFNVVDGGATYICCMMEDKTLHAISAVYGWKDPAFIPIIAGLINHTWKVSESGRTWLLQRINTDVFPEPEKIDENLRLLAEFLSVHEPNYLFTALVPDLSGKTLVRFQEQSYRVFPWIDETHTVSAVNEPVIAETAAACFGDFTYRLRSFPAKSLHETLPGFHDLAWRYFQMETAVREGDVHRMYETRDLINLLKSLKKLVLQNEQLILHAEVKKRVIHHDTKISNVLLNDQNKAVAVIDLDTVMPGYVTSDVGDMFRTYVCPVTEEEANLDLIHVRKGHVDAIIRGYLQSMGDELSDIERDHLYFGGEIIIYMQALRFLTDYLMRDVYYGCSYEKQNLVRAENQIRLLQLFQESLR